MGTAIKAQALADFVVELTHPGVTSNHTGPPWVLYVDGSSTLYKSGAGLVLIDPDGHSFQTALEFDFEATNNEAEYEALINGLEMATSIGITRLQVCMDSQLVVNQITSDYEVRDERMKGYLEITQEVMKRFAQIYVQLIPRESNSQADTLARLATSDGPAEMKDVTVTKLSQPTRASSLVMATDG